MSGPIDRSRELVLSCERADAPITASVEECQLGRRYTSGG
ncbi:hypothetical protein L838_0338 [Mycobacterium avium MAV_120709_2344]|nr:hypothetical protein L842_2993 [Mycobacterium intracellulare MIN_052511_1280]ETZ57284.1 hypothetical protein L838_0338 [Mycobacterium avium MAV_120709_2344]